MINVTKFVDELIVTFDKYLTSMDTIKDENNAALLGIVIKDLTTLKVIRKNLEFKHTGSSIMVLSRTIVESMINVKFMELKGADKQLEKFRKFEISEAMQDVEYLSGKGVDVSQLDPDEVKKRFEKNKDNFIRKDGSYWQSWSHLNTDQMLEELLKSSAINPDEIKTIISTYIYGSRKTHLSPTDIKLYLLGKNVLETKDVLDKRLAIVAGTSSLIITGIVFAKRIKNSQLEKDLTNFLTRMDVGDISEIK